MKNIRKQTESCNFTVVEDLKKVLEIHLSKPEDTIILLHNI